MGVTLGRGTSGPNKLRDHRLEVLLPSGRPCSHLNRSRNWHKRARDRHQATACEPDQPSLAELLRRADEPRRPHSVAMTTCGVLARAPSDFVLGTPAVIQQHTRRPRNLADEVAALQAAYPTAEVQLWTTDEHRIGLRPLVRRVWARKGKRPIAPVQQRYEWLYVYRFVRPTTGQTVWWLLSTVTAVLFAQVLASFAREVEAGSTKRILLVLDGVGWHTGEAVQVRDGNHLLFLPAYAPELQPAEHLWPLTNEPLANRCFATMEALEAVQAEHCLALQQQPERIRQHTCFRWWPTHASPLHLFRIPYPTP